MNEDEDGEEEVTEEDEMDEDGDVPYSDEIEGEEEEEDEEDHFAGQVNGIKSRVNGYAKATAEDSRGSLCCICKLNGKKEADLVGLTVAGETTTPELFTSAGAQQALHPLRRTADRVTRQIEAFAEKLDRFKQKGNRADDFGRFQAAYQLVQSYQTFTQDAIQDISKQSTLKRAKIGLSTSRNETVAQDSKTEEELQRLQLEANTWQLLLNLISIDNPAGHEMDKEAQETAFQKLHRYSSDREVWEQFLTADPYARECVIVLKWLEHTAKTQSQDIDSLIADLEKQAERGKGLWAHGWLYTKEAIKGQKRLRAWPQPLEPNDPGITISLLRSDKSGAMITQLDPDAITRQKNLLQKQDQFHERATWMTCWKMIRQGESWTKMREWAQERLENWRAVSLCGSSVDKDSHVGKTPMDDGTTRMMNFRSHGPWQAACSASHTTRPRRISSVRCTRCFVARRRQPSKSAKTMTTTSMSTSTASCSVVTKGSANSSRESLLSRPPHRLPLCLSLLVTTTPASFCKLPRATNALVLKHGTLTVLFKRSFWAADMTVSSSGWLRRFRTWQIASLTARAMCLNCRPCRLMSRCSSLHRMKTP